MKSLLESHGYIPISFISEGKYSYVYKVYNLEDKKIYALKIITSYPKESEKSIDFNEEIHALSISSHQNVVKLCNVIQYNQFLLLILEYSPYKLTDVIKMNPPESIIKGIMLMLLKGISHLHKLGIVHRDIKPSNILINQEGILKICDLGLCKFYIKDDKSTTQHETWSSQAGTSYYRAPELIFGSEKYDNKVDIWAVGCIMAELINGKVLFKSQNELEQIELIMNLLGTPNENVWEDFAEISDNAQLILKDKKPMNLHKVFPNWNDNEIDLFSKLLVYDPKKRISALEAMGHNWFFSEPVPVACQFDGSKFDLFSRKYI